MAKMGIMITKWKMKTTMAVKEAIKIMMKSRFHNNNLLISENLKILGKMLKIKTIIILPFQSSTKMQHLTAM